MNIMRRGEIAGILCLTALIASFIVALVFGVGKSVMGDVLALAIYLMVCLTYVVFLFSVKEIVKSTGNLIFMQRMKVFLIVMVVSCFFIAPLAAPILVSDFFEKMLGIVFTVLTVIMGVVSIRIAPFFTKLEGDLSECGRKTAKWFKISGWLMATVVLSVVGMFLSLIADFYMWKLVKQERLNLESK